MKSIKHSSGKFDRVFLILSTLIYAASIYYAYKTYLYPVWEYYGFSYSEPTLIEYIFAISTLIPTAATLPKYYTRPSSIVLLFLYAIVFVPSIVVTLCLDGDSLMRHLSILVAITISFTTSSIYLRSTKTTSEQARGIPGSWFLYTFGITWIIIVAANYYIYNNVMSFAVLDNIYDQREAGASKNFFTAYSQTLFSNVFTPTLFSLGLILKRHLLVLAGLTGCIFIYTITAQRTVLLLPVVIYLFYRLQISPIKLLKTTGFPLLILAGITFLTCLFYEDSLVGSVLATLLVFRTIALPGLTYTQYYDFFSQYDYTWWSHVKGFSLFIPIPDSYVNSSLWPGLGYMIGEYVYDKADVNANANLYSGDGVAAAGWFGVILIGFLFSGWLRLLDITASKWDQKFTTLAILPLAISLTNGHFFTSLLSFGGLLWLIIFKQFSPKTYKCENQ